MLAVAVGRWRWRRIIGGQGLAAVGRSFAFDGKVPFSAASLERIRELKQFYELDLDSSASHRLEEIMAKSPRQPGDKVDHRPRGAGAADRHRIHNRPRQSI